MDIEKYLSSFFKGTKDPSLEAMKYFMEELGYPEKDLKIIHIAGTNGKGSCAEMLTNILSLQGYKVGKFMSPHLIKYNERISIGNIDILDCELEEYIKLVDPKVQKYNETHESKITLFELETTIALLHFCKNECDFVVLEAGLGGLYDCTNVVTPLISVIVSVGYDHMDILGSNLSQIAEQKAGIIKENSETVFVEQDEEVNNIISETCKNKNNILHLVKNKNIKNYSYNGKYQKFDHKNYQDIEVNLKGEKQIYNASICLECVEILRKKGYEISEESVRKALKTVVHKGRFEKIHENPTMIYDGGHNEPAIQNFKNSVDMYYKNEHKVYIISVLKRKDYKMVLQELLADPNAVFIFTSGNDKESYMSKEDLLDYAKKLKLNENLYAKELPEALKFAKTEFANSVTFVVGSFYVYGDVKKYLEN